MLKQLIFYTNSYIVLTPFINNNDGNLNKCHLKNRSILFFDDSGPGVPQGALDHLFDRLYRVDRSRSRAQGGSGLGLSICKSIVNALGGEIRASNGYLGGLRIEVEFPHTG